MILPVSRPAAGAFGATRHRSGRSATAAGFTLLELLVVIVIIGLLAALTVPSLKNVQKSNAQAAASQQIIDDVALARRLAIKDRTTILMIFQPVVTTADAAIYAPLNTGEKAVLLRAQQSGYALYSFRQVGDQPGDLHPRYARPWRYLPNGYFIPAWKFLTTGLPTSISATNSRERAMIDIRPFDRTSDFNLVPVPTLKSPRRVPVKMPYIAFGPSGGLQVENASGEFVAADADVHIPLARGATQLARDPADEKTLTWEPADISEKPDGNSLRDFHVIVIDRLTGRTRVAKPEISP